MAPAGNISWHSQPAAFTQQTAQKGDEPMMSQPYVDGITDTVPHHIASSLTADQTAADKDTLSVPVICPDRWFPRRLRGGHQP